MGYTYEQKLELANKIRVQGKRKSEVPEEYEKYLSEVDVKECYMETRHGKTHYYKVQSKDKKSGVPLVLNMHGGGFIKGYGRQDTANSAMLAVKTGAVVLDVDYKVAPEYPFPVSIHEGYDVMKWAYEHADELGVDKSKFIVDGRSSGGNNVAAIALEVARTKEFVIRLQILEYPPMDLYTDPDKKPEPYKSHVPSEVARAYNSLYITTEEEKKNPYVSMVFATPDMLKSLPDALVITANLDVLYSEAEKYAFMMMEAGVKVTIKKYLNSAHGFTGAFKGDEWPYAHKLIVDTINNL